MTACSLRKLRYKNSKFSPSRIMNLIPLINGDLLKFVGEQNGGSFVERISHLNCVRSPSLNEGIKEGRAASLCGDLFQLKGNCGNLLKLLLFNSGVGAGMVFALASKKHGTPKVIRLLEAVMNVSKSLKDQIKNRDNFRLGLDTINNVKTISLEQSCAELESVVKMVKQAQTFALKNCETFSAMDNHCSQERATLEAELEAELERMELNLDIGEHLSGISEGDMYLRHDNDDLMKVDQDNEFHKLGAKKSSAVPPLELAKRLYEVLEARQQEKIVELEAEIKRLDTGLQAKEHQFQAWKGRLRFLLQGLSSLQNDPNVEEDDTNTNNYTSKKELFVAGLERSASLLPNDKHILSNLHSTSAHASKDIHAPSFKLLAKTRSGSPTYLYNDKIFKDADEICFRKISTRAEPETIDVSYCSTSSPSSDIAVNDGPGSAPCSVTRSAGCVRNRLKIGIEEERVEGKESLYFGGNRHHVLYPRKIHCSQGVIDIHDHHRMLGRKMSNGSCMSLDLDEQLDQLLIKRIVEKGRSGVLMVEAAKVIMDSFDIESISSERQWALNGVSKSANTFDTCNSPSMMSS